MQGKKQFTQQLFYELSLERLVPQDNFYREVDKLLDLHFLYAATNKTLNQYECIQAGGNKAILPFKGIRTDSKGYAKKTFRSSEKDCKNCPLRIACCGQTTKFKKLDESIHKPLYDKMHKKLTENKAYHRRLVKRRSATVEPVLGTLINFYNLKRVNTRGIAQTNKHVLMTALCYNLKKYMKFTRKKPTIQAQAMSKVAEMLFSLKNDFYYSF